MLTVMNKHNEITVHMGKTNLIPSQINEGMLC